MNATSENGFTLVELLVTTITIGILAAIALPNFLHQTTKAQDASAKVLVRSGETALQSYAVENDGYGATRAELLELAPELGDAEQWALNASPTGYTLSVSAHAQTFTVTRALNGPSQRTCTVPGQAGCPSNGLW